MAQEINKPTTEEVTAAAIAGAAMTGAKNAVNEKIVEPLSKLTQPYDMNLEHAPHPIDDLTTKIDHVEAGIRRLAESGDMNANKLPHPVDNAIASASHKIEDFKAAGPIRGTEMASEAIVAAAIDGINPGKKGEMVGRVLENAADASNTVKKVSDVRNVEGELVGADIHAEKGLALQNHLEPAPSTLDRLKNKALDVAGKIPVVGDILDPALDQRIIRQAHNEKPGVIAMHDEQHRIGGDVDALSAQHEDKVARASVIAEMVRSSPEAMANNRNITKEQISTLLNRTTNEQLGLEHNPNSVPKLASPEQQIVNDTRLAQLEAGKARLAAELEYQASLPLAERLARKAYMNTADSDGKFTGVQMYGDTKMLKLENEATDLESKVMADGGKKTLRGTAQLLGVVGAGVAAATHDWRNDEERNGDLAKSFLHAVDRGNQGIKELVMDHKELKNAVEQYKVVENQLSKDGATSAQDRVALQGVATNYAKQIQEKGPESFGEVSQSNEINKVAAQDLSRH